MGTKITLLVEDNADDEMLALRAMKKNKIPTEVMVARDGAEALEFLFCQGKYSHRDVREIPEIVLLDLNLPKVSGLEVLKRIRSSNRTKRIPVVILTSSKEDRDLIGCYDAGANSYIRKPVDFVQFGEAVQQLISYWLDLNESPRIKGVD